jgi:hypothetical protein
LNYPYPVIRLGDEPAEFYATLREHGIKRWKILSTPLTVDEYRQQNAPLSDDQERATTTFVPKIEAIDFEEPGTDVPFTGVRLNTKPWASVVALLPQDPDELNAFATHRDWVKQLSPQQILDSLICLTYEFKHGVGDLYKGQPHDACTIVTPSGVPNKAEWERGYASLEDCARREFLNEFGLELDRLEPLGPTEYGFSVSPRRSNETVQPFFVSPKLPLAFQQRKSGKSEQLFPFFMTVQDYLRLARQGLLIEIYSTGIMYLVLDHLGRLNIQ